MIELTYLAYLTITVGVTVLVALSMRRHGRAFLVDAFLGDQPLADAVNKLFAVTFYLLNFGVILLLLRWGKRPKDALQMLEYLSWKVGLVFLVLGVLHSLKVRRLATLRRRALEQRSESQRKES